MKQPIFLAVLIVSSQICFGASALFAQEAKTEEFKSMFDAPVFLIVKDEPMNEDGWIKYPSPVIFDIDNDGANELILGSISGRFYACKNRNSETGEPVWSKPIVVRTIDGKPLELNNR